MALKGATGAQGIQGIQGLQGIQGVQGIQGPKGDKGATGDKGSAATVAIGTVTTGNPGTNASVVNVGTTSAAVLNITIPRGLTGAQGTSSTGDYSIDGGGASSVYLASQIIDGGAAVNG